MKSSQRKSTMGQHAASSHKHESIMCRTADRTCELEKS
jgi:hypothetical protein